METGENPGYHKFWTNYFRIDLLDDVHMTAKV